MLERQVNHMVRLVDDLLEVSRITHLFSRDKLTFAVVDGREHVIAPTHLTALPEVVRGVRRDFGEFLLFPGADLV